MKILLIASTLSLAVLFGVNEVHAQNATKAPARSTVPVIFAVIDDGSTIEPIALVENGKLITDDDRLEPAALAKAYYRSGSKYNLIFGGVTSGTIAIKRSKVGTECGGSAADVSVQSGKAKLSGFVMGLATNIAVNAKATGLRRLPTAAERTEIETLIRDEYRRNKVSASASKQLHYYNLTAVDADNDGTPEMIGSYWIAPSKDRRDLLFFIAEKGASDKYAFTYSKYSAVTSKDLMSGDLRDLDTMGGELLLELFDYDKDGVSEIFTIEKAFEGNNYHAYARSGRKWAKVIDAYDYRCAF